MDQEKLTMREQELLNRPIARRTTYEEKKPLYKRPIFWILVVIVCIIAAFVSFITFLNEIFYPTGDEATIYDKNGITIVFQDTDEAQFALTVKTTREEQVHIGVTDLFVDGRAMTFNAHPTNPSYSQLNKLDLELEDLNVLIKSTYLVQDELGILYINQPNAMSNEGDKQYIKYIDNSSSKMGTNTKGDISFVLTIYTIPTTIENFNAFGFAAVDESYNFVYMKEEASIKVENKK
jgi:hypothetical protein